MKPVVVIEAGAVLATDALFEEQAISALVRLSVGADLVLLTEPAVRAAWREAEAILNREGVLFVAEHEVDGLLDGLGKLVDEYTEDGRHVSVVARAKADSRIEIEKVAVFYVDDTRWAEVVQQILFPPRVATCVRRTSETAIATRVNLDGRGTAEISTGLGFFDHMLEQLARHSRADISISVSGDLDIDEHHTIEDTALCLGEAFGQAIGEKRGIERYAFVLPMDDSLAHVAFDWSGRSWLVWEAEFKREKIGDMPTEMFFHFFKSFCDAARCNLNISVQGSNEHHMIESIFKAFGRCLRHASTRHPDDDRVPSTKGTL
jgi:imidazoleglycerol phosphate dehydratase HisB